MEKRPYYSLKQRRKVTVAEQENFRIMETDKRAEVRPLRVPSHRFESVRRIVKNVFTYKERSINSQEGGDFIG